MKAILSNLEGKKIDIEYTDSFSLMSALMSKHGFANANPNSIKDMKLTVAHNISKALSKDLQKMCVQLHGLTLDLTGNWEEESNSGKSSLDSPKKLVELGLTDRDDIEKYKSILEMGETFRTEMKTFLSEKCKKTVAVGIYIGNKDLSKGN